ncbi:transmembrane protein 150A isoform X1 [Erpetoichthys calabaricus]|uniref:Si:dkey-228d14.5 n=1 Tax=Erpetoichthys calabaricus TaxID=27687 RepID=A0A8C4S6U5_ERPCA|nr:transmembrane protein 150A isoform X1 [Erpetoichthys calabaricus]
MGFWLVFPVLLFLITFAGQWTVYGLALAYHHVCPLHNWKYTNSCHLNLTQSCCTIQHIPFISTCGMSAPENSLFTATLNAGSALFILFCIFHHAHMIDKNNDHLALSRVGLAVGCTSALGAFIAGNCNPSSLMILHYLGASLNFVCACLYTTIQTVLTYRCYVTGLEHLLAPIRTVLTINQILSTIIYILFFVQPSPYYLHLSAIFEWVLGTNMELFALTFAVEFYFFTDSTLWVLTKKHDEEKALILS